VYKTRQDKKLGVGEKKKAFRNQTTRPPYLPNGGEEERRLKGHLA
jgi:hypothetical protein